MGTEEKPGTRPGLVHVKKDSVSDPLALPQAITTVSLTGGSDGSPAASKASYEVKKKDDGTSNAFTVEAKKAGAAGDQTKITISNVEEDKGTFNLEAVWTYEQAGIKRGGLSGLNDSANSASYEIKVEQPDTGFDVPAAGTIVLRGGADMQAAKRASAEVPAG